MADSIANRFNRLQMPSRLASPAGTTATNQYGQTSFAGNRRNPPMMMRPTAPTLSPMMREVLRQAQMKKAQEAQQAASGMPMPGVLPISKPTPPPSQPSGFMGAFSQPLASPVGQAISQAAIAGARASDWSPTPVSLGRVLAEMGAAASEGYAGAQDRELTNLLTQAKIAEKLGTAGQFYKGSSVTAQDRNIVLNLAPKIKDGTATEPEQQQYAISYQALSTPRTEQRTAADGTVTTVQVPGMDLSNLPTPAGLKAGETVIGTKKPDFSGDKLLAGSFANRMIDSQTIFDRLTTDGYDPTNTRDYAASNLPVIAQSAAMSSQGQQYLAAKKNFITAVLRKESGAAISATEFETEDIKYFPQPGDSAATIEQKRLARKTAIDAMKAQSGGAFEFLQKEGMGASSISSLPKGSVFIERAGGKSFYRTPDGKTLVVD